MNPGAGWSFPNPVKQPSPSGSTRALRVCSHPDDLPYSHRTLPSLGARLTEWLGDHLNRPVRPAWIRWEGVPPGDAACDLSWWSTGDPDSWIRTDPYYHSSYHHVALASRDGLPDGDTGSRTGPLRVGVEPSVDTGVLPELLPRLPGKPSGLSTRFLEKKGTTPGETLPRALEVLRRGEVDLLVARGEWAGYWARRSGLELVHRSLAPGGSGFDPTDPAVYGVSVALRGDRSNLGSSIRDFLDRRREKIRSLLGEDFGVPLLEREKSPGETTPVATPDTPSAAPSPADTGSANPFEASPAVLKDGKKLYQSMNCYACHGHGGGGKIGPSLGDSRWIYGKSDAEIFASIKKGRPGGMPGFARHMTDDQIWKLTVFVRTFGDS